MAGAMPAATADGANLAQTSVRAAQRSDDSAAQAAMDATNAAVSKAQGEPSPEELAAAKEKKQWDDLDSQEATYSYDSFGAKTKSPYSAEHPEGMKASSRNVTGYILPPPKIPELGEK